MEKRQNPLQQYFRQIKLFIKLPSGTSYYTPEIVEFTNDEVGVLPMTGKDELILKNPDALLNGESLIEVITSCVPCIKKPRLLLTNDLDALITAIRYATYNDSLEMNLRCPKCDAENTYKLDLQYALDHMTYLDEEYVVNLSNGLSVFIKPHAFPEMLAGLQAQFESNKLARAIDSDTITDEEKSKIFAKAFREIAISKFNLMTNTVIKIVDEKNNINVTEKQFISEFLQNIDRESINQIDLMVDEINKIGIKKTFKATCASCSHHWENDIDFNPINFS